MALTPGTRVGAYEVLGAIGAGGMGEVYRARDTRLNRDVAIKVLPEVFAADPERVARFTREAQTLASLNHPNIAAIYGIEGSALVMELVTGEDLSAILARGPLAVSDALPIAKQIADAVEAAHELGVVHRDLKPANIKVRADGHVKVLDFGLAKAMDPSVAIGGGSDPANSPTITSPAALSRMGVILGTAAYMAPEQARGRAVDKRADIWAYGVILYEMLTGRRAFQGEDTSDVIAAVLRQDIDWAALPPSTPSPIRSLVRDCLARDPRQRLRDIGDARRALEKAIDDGNASHPADAPVPVPAPAPGPAAAARVARWLPWAIAVASILVAIAAGVAVVRRSPSGTAPPVLHATLPVGGVTANYGVSAPGIAIARDGSTVVFMGEDNGRRALFVRRLDRPGAALIRGSEDGSYPFLSPDGAWVGFLADDGNLKKVSIGGGVPMTLCPASDMRGASWGGDGFIVFTPNSQDGLWRVKESGGAAERLTTRDPVKHEKTHRLPDVLPNGKGVLFMIGTTDVDTWDDSTIAVLPPSGPPKPVAKGMMPRYVAPGYLIYAHGGDLLAAPFDVDRLEVTGPAVSVSSDVAMTSAMGVAEAAISSTGLTYLTGHSSVRMSVLVEADGTGAMRTVSHAPRTIVSARWLPDHQRVLLNIDSGNSFVWMLDARREAFSRLTFHNDAGSSAWNRATGRALYASVGQLISVTPDGSGHEDVVYRSEKLINDFDVSPDGQSVMFVATEGATSQLWMLHVATGIAERWLPSRFNQMQPRFSPDGRWVAYVSNEAGQPEVYVSATTGGDTKVQASAGGGVLPAWGPGGAQLFYADRTHLMVTDVRNGASIDIDTPRPLFQLPARSLFQDVAPDGQHFLLMQHEAEPVPPAIAFVWGWLATITAQAGR